MTSSNQTNPLWENAPLPGQILDHGARIVAVNKAWELLTGFSESEAKGRPYLDLVPEEAIDAFTRNLSELKEAGRLNGAECLIRHKGGSIRNVLVYAHMSDDDPPLIQCQLVDSTKQIAAKEAIAESEQRFRSLFELSPTPIVIHNGRSIILANAATASFLGFDSAADAIGKPIADMVHPDSLPRVAERVRHMMSEDWTAPLVVEKYVRSDGDTVYAETAASPIEVDGERCIQVVAIDISKRQMAEAALEESEERFRHIFEASPDPIVVHNGKHPLMVNRVALEAFGVDPDSDYREISIIDLIHPASLEAVQLRMVDLISGDNVDERIDIRLLRADGSVWDADIATAMLVLDGKRVFRSTFRDMTKWKRAQAELEQYRIELEDLLDARTRNLDAIKADLTAVSAVIGRAVEIRDPYTAGHQRRVAELATEIGKALKFDEEDIRNIEVAAGMHDVGKISIPGEIMSKPSHLSALEYELVKTHAQAGYDIVVSAKVHEQIAEIILQHHERLDGSGYPRGLSEGEVLPSARILAVADVFEAMASHRPYRPARGADAALEELNSGKGSLYDGAVVDACTALIRGGFEFTTPEG